MEIPRLARYLKGTAEFGVWLPAAGDTDYLDGLSDTFLPWRVPQWIIQPRAGHDLPELW